MPATCSLERRDEPLLRAAAPPAERRPPVDGDRRRAGGRVRHGDQELRARPADRRGEEGRVRRHPRDPRRHQAVQVDRDDFADAVGRAADRQAGEERRGGEPGRSARAVRRLDAAAHHSGEAVRAPSVRRRDRAGARPVAPHRGAERDRADEGALRRRSRQARRRSRRYGRAHRERQGETDACRFTAAAPRAGREDQVGSHLRGSRRGGEIRGSARRRSSTCSGPSAA